MKLPFENVVVWYVMDTMIMNIEKRLKNKYKFIFKTTVYHIGLIYTVLPVIVVKTDDAEQLPISMTILAVTSPAATRWLPAQTSRAAGIVAIARFSRATCKIMKFLMIFLISDINTNMTFGSAFYTIRYLG